MNGIILAGGRGTRMGGIDKAFLPLGGETFIARILGVLRPLCGGLVIVTNAPALYEGLEAEVVTDDRDGMGPLMGLYCGLRRSGAQSNFVTAVDAPLLQPSLVRCMSERAGQGDVVVPFWKGGLEPLCALYSRRCLPAIEKVIEERRLVSFFPLVKVRRVGPRTLSRADPHGYSFINVNSPEDYQRIQAIEKTLPPK